MHMGCPILRVLRRVGGRGMRPAGANLPHAPHFLRISTPLFLQPVFLRAAASYHSLMAFPIKVCIVCEEEFELKPDKPGFANRCPECSAPESNDAGTKHSMDADERKALAEANEARRAAIRDLLYTRK